MHIPPKTIIICKHAAVIIYNVNHLNDWLLFDVIVSHICQYSVHVCIEFVNRTFHDYLIWWDLSGSFSLCVMHSFHFIVYTHTTHVLPMKLSLILSLSPRGYILCERSPGWQSNEPVHCTNSVHFAIYLWWFDKYAPKCSNEAEHNESQIDDNKRLNSEWNGRKKKTYNTNIQITINTRKNSDHAIKSGVCDNEPASFIQSRYFYHCINRLDFEIVSLEPNAKYHCCLCVCMWACVCMARNCPETPWLCTMHKWNRENISRRWLTHTVTYTHRDIYKLVTAIWKRQMLTPIFHNSHTFVCRMKCWWVSSIWLIWTGGRSAMRRNAKL